MVLHILDYKPDLIQLDFLASGGQTSQLLYAGISLLPPVLIENRYSAKLTQNLSAGEAICGAVGWKNDVTPTLSMNVNDQVIKPFRALLVDALFSSQRGS